MHTHTYKPTLGYILGTCLDGAKVYREYNGKASTHLINSSSLAQHWPEWLKQANGRLIEPSAQITKITTYLQ